MLKYESQVRFQSNRLYFTPASTFCIRSKPATVRLADGRDLLSSAVRRAVPGGEAGVGELRQSLQCPQCVIYVDAEDHFVLLKNLRWEDGVGTEEGLIYGNAYLVGCVAW